MQEQYTADTAKAVAHNTETDDASFHENENNQILRHISIDFPTPNRLNSLIVYEPRDASRSVLH
jgi:hypothetical protein